MDHILYQIHNYFPPIRITQQIKNRIKIKIKTWYYLELLTSETMKLLRNTKNNETTEKMEKMYFNQKLLKQYQSIVILSAMITNMIQRSCIHLFLINRQVNFQLFYCCIIYSQESLTHSFYILKYGSQIKILNRQRQKIK